MSAHPSTKWQRLVEAADRPVDVASIALLRIALGLILLWEVWRYFHYGWIRDFYVTPLFHFTYPGLGWIKPWPGFGMYAHFFALGVASILVALGLFYRVAISVLAVGFTYVLLLEQTAFLNHLYLVCLICVLMIFVPADREWVWRPGRSLQSASRSMPSWCLWLIRAQLAVPYVYGGLVKFNPDWLQGQPLQLWMWQMVGLREILPAYGERWLAVAMCIAGLVIDLCVVPALLCRATRKWALGIAIAFHLWNSAMFHIGIFPWFMIVATTVFLPPSWPRAVLGTVVLRNSKVPRMLPNESDRTSWCHSLPHPLQNDRSRTVKVSLVAVWFAVQLLVPFRHLLYEGNVDWTEEGARFAWRMMLHDKWSAMRFTLVDPQTKKTRPFNPRAFLSQRQVDKMSYEPELLRVFSHQIADLAEASGLGRVEVHVEVWCSLNGRQPQLLIDPGVNLANEPYRWQRQPWILPLTQPLGATPWIPPPEMRGLDGVGVLPRKMLDGTE